MRKLTRDQVIEKFKAVHGDRYDYSSIEYVNMSTPVTIICPEHGEFRQFPTNHIKGVGCPSCGGNKRMSTDEFKKLLLERYPGTGISFDKVEYVNNHTPVTLVCPKHGEFSRWPSSLIKNMECPECQKARLSAHFSSNTEEFVKKAAAVHGDKYSYQKVEYSNHTTPVLITCPEHGDFLQTPMTHLAGSGCPECGNKAMWDKRGRIDTDTWVERAKAVHGDRYDYAESEYTGGHEKVKITCRRHGPFWQDAYAHANGQGCPQCGNELSRSADEDELFEFMKSILPDEDVESGNRRVLHPLELDIYIPSRNIAIEYDGLYWHNEANQPSKAYHLDKTRKCAEKGIRLIHVFEDEWVLEKDKVKSRLKSILGIYDRRISASKCKVNVLDSRQAMKFLADNHLQGACGAKYRYGLFLGDELVSVMTFGMTRKNVHGTGQSSDYELVRYCSKRGTMVVGGAERLMTHFVRDHRPKSIVSYADMRWSDGDLYRKLGFTHVHDSRPSYFYIVNNKRENRFKYRKDLLVSEGFDRSKSEHEIMLERGIFRIYDCGCMVFRKTFE